MAGRAMGLANPVLSQLETASVFVFAVVGERHVRAAEVALNFLRRFSRLGIVVVQARSHYRAAHCQVIEVDLPHELDDRQASIYLKTNLLEYVGGLGDRFCYLDSDVIAVNYGVDMLFSRRVGPVNFAADHVGIDVFSRWAVNCHCRETRCDHLREAILSSFGINVRDRAWPIWNGGVFLFDHTSATFLQQWHDFALWSFGESFWRTRDQGTLAATVWKFGLERASMLPSSFNTIVDRMWGIAPADRLAASPAQFQVSENYSLDGKDGRPKPFFLHFVNGGVGQSGWRNWDEVSRLADGASDN